MAASRGAHSCVTPHPFLKNRDVLRARGRLKRRSTGRYSPSSSTITRRCRKIKCDSRARHRHALSAPSTHPTRLSRAYFQVASVQHPACLAPARSLDASTLPAYSFRRIPLRSTPTRIHAHTWIMETRHSVVLVMSLIELNITARSYC
ncbi:hypothetical protein PLICRDRAFT_527249 [Plicaturopsis crispa FD-325 SS-3]|nr:hypothetical protein PLICRDRAFT_527249 [Plicaturopsis crispa FD-325 SS-3]